MFFCCKLGTDDYVWNATLNNAGDYIDAANLPLHYGQSFKHSISLEFYSHPIYHASDIESSQPDSLFVLHSY